ncbi:MAG: metal ABC transporter ATP-binding protein [candidate division Zixibacteria bacterium]|nr:metal ABC transporter ATP-binding protein [candidate division Zixibacteria bacterium]
MGPTIYLKNITAKADRLKILENIDAVIPGGSVTALVGPNGAGKTTLLKVILGKAPFSGELQFKDAENKMVKPQFGYVPQSMDFDRGLPMTVLDFLVMPFQNRPLWLGKQSRLVETTLENLSLVEAEHLSRRQIGKLSGGELQRILLASALAGDPNLLLLDEPVSGIDISGEKLFCDLLDSIQHRRRFTMIIVSHDLSVVSNHAERVICLNRKLVCQGTTGEVLTPDNLRAVFGHHTEIFMEHPIWDGKQGKDATAGH